MVRSSKADNRIRKSYLVNPILPVESMSDADLTELTTERIDITSVARRVVPPECGATVTLDGYARRFTKNKETGDTRETDYLVYEAYEPMAVKEMQKLVEQAKREFEITNVGIVHRLGKLEIGETSVVISVAGPHRRAAFAACE